MVFDDSFEHEVWADTIEALITYFFADFSRDQVFWKWPQNNSKDFMEYSEDEDSRIILIVDILHPSLNETQRMKIKKGFTSPVSPY